MQTTRFNLGGGNSVVMPTHDAAKQLLEQLEASKRSYQNTVGLKIGEYVPGEGGYFAGDIMGDDGVTYGLIDAGRQATVKGTWGADGEIQGLSQWDGLANTHALRERGSPIADLVAGYQKDGHSDFYLPARREQIIALANIPHMYDKKWHFTSTPCGSISAWVVDFQFGAVTLYHRRDERLARPFRRIIY